MTLSQAKLEKKYGKTIAQLRLDYLDMSDEERGEWLRDNEVGGGVLGLSPKEYPTKRHYWLPDTDYAKTCDNCRGCDDYRKGWMCGYWQEGEAQLSWL